MSHCDPGVRAVNPTTGPKVRHVNFRYMVNVRDIEFEGVGVRLRGERWAPEGPSLGTVVLLHGGGQTRGSWKQTTPRLAESGWTAIALDLRGHGDSDWAPNGSYTFES